MPQLPLTDRQFLKKQYRDASNLNKRVQLHDLFSVNHYGWQRWVFDQLDLAPRSRILELGCGPGHLWLENLTRISDGWEITLSDLSAGMVEQARQNLAGKGPFQFKVINTQSIPGEEEQFEAVIANHMLYHVPDRPAALREIRRVLKPGGHFHASTVGERHLVEIRDLIVQFDPALAAWGCVSASFTLENGLAQLAPWFGGIQLTRYGDALEVTEAAPLVDYILSGWAQPILEGRRAAFSDFITHALEEGGGSLHVSKDSGLFMSSKDGG